MKQYRTYTREFHPDYDGEWEELENYEYTVANSEDEALEEDVDFIVQNTNGTVNHDEYGCTYIEYYNDRQEREVKIEVRTEPVEDGYTINHTRWIPGSGNMYTEEVDYVTDVHPGDAEEFGRDWIEDAMHPGSIWEPDPEKVAEEYDGDSFEITDFGGRVVDKWIFDKDENR